MSEKLLYRFSILLTLLTLICMGANDYIHPLPTHDGVWTLTPVFSALQGNWSEDIYTGYRLPFLHYYLKIPYYWVVGNSIYGPFILNILINILYVYVIVKFAKKYKLSSVQTWLIACLFISCNVFSSLRPEHLINLLLLLYYLNHHRLTSIWQNLFICIVFIAVHPAAGLFAFLFNIINTNFSLKNILIQMGTLLLIFVALFFIFPQFSETMLSSLKLRYEGNLLLPFYSFCKACFFINIYYIYRLIFSSNTKRDLVQWLAFIMLAALLGKDYYYDYVVVFVLYKCIINPPGTTNFYYFQWAFAFASFCAFPLHHLYFEISNYRYHSNLKEVLYKIGEVVSQNDKMYQVPMEFALPAMGNKNVILEYHNLETNTYRPLIKNIHASTLVTEKSQEHQKVTLYTKQWIPSDPTRKYCLFEVLSLPQ